MTAASDPWAVLGVEPSAGIDEARHAYVIRSQLLHPDRHQGAHPAVLAEAERAMRELNDAWELIRTGAAPPPPPPRSVLPPDADGCISWIIGRMEDVASRDGDPLTPEEAARLRSPLATAPSGRRFTRWVDHRRVTLQRAMADARDPGTPDTGATGSDAADWQQAWRVIAEARLGVVLLLLVNAA